MIEVIELTKVYTPFALQVAFKEYSDLSFDVAITVFFYAIIVRKLAVRGHRHTVHFFLTELGCA